MKPPEVMKPDLLEGYLQLRRGVPSIDAGEEQRGIRGQHGAEDSAAARRMLRSGQVR